MCYFTAKNGRHIIACGRRALFLTQDFSRVGFGRTKSFNTAAQARLGSCYIILRTSLSCIITPAPRPGPAQPGLARPRRGKHGLRLYVYSTNFAVASHRRTAICVMHVGYALSYTCAVQARLRKRLGFRGAEFTFVQISKAIQNKNRCRVHVVATT